MVVPTRSSSKEKVRKATHWKRYVKRNFATCYWKRERKGTKWRLRHGQQIKHWKFFEMRTYFQIVITLKISVLSFPFKIMRYALFVYARSSSKEKVLKGDSLKTWAAKKTQGVFLHGRKKMWKVATTIQLRNENRLIKVFLFQNANWLPNQRNSHFAILCAKFFIQNSMSRCLMAWNMLWILLSPCHFLLQW